MRFTRLKQKWKKFWGHDAPAEHNANRSGSARGRKSDQQSTVVTSKPNDTRASSAQPVAKAPQSAPPASSTRDADHVATEGPAKDQGNAVDIIPLSKLDSATLEAIASADPTIAETIWNDAYDKLKGEDGTLVETYEKIMSLRLQNRELSLSEAEFASLENPIGHDISSRRRQMHQLIHVGLERTMQEAEAKKAISGTLKYLKAAKNVVDTAIKNVPQAALPWAVVCLSLDIIANPVDETAANRDGIKHVMETMTWYSKLVECLLEDNKADNELQRLQNELKHQITNFYKELLEFEVKSIISYYRHRGLGFLRDVIKFDDWAEAIKEIKKTEEHLRDHIQQFNSVNQQNHQSTATAQQEHQKDMHCLRDLVVTDPRMEKHRIEEIKGGLYEESYSWILENKEYKSWTQDKNKKLLWMRGDPGKGKTMLLCGIINELKQLAAPHSLTYFFCQATSPAINKHVNVLRGLIWLLATEEPRLISHIRKRYDASGKVIFEDSNAWWTLSTIFRDMLHDVESPYIAIDGLDECLTGLTPLLDLLKDLSRTTSAKWILSSRNWPEIESVLGPASSLCGMSLSLEVNAALVTKAVDAYISHRVDEMSQLVSDKELLERVANKIRERANGTFLWVAIVFQQLRESLESSFDEAQEILQVLDESHDDLTALYTLMLQKIERQTGRARARCRRILAVATLAQRPMHIEELAAVEGFTGNLANVAELEKLVRRCGSFLTVRDDYIYFIHYSAKEYLEADEFAMKTLFPEGRGVLHYGLSLKSINYLKTVLRRNMYGLDEKVIKDSEESLAPDPDPHKALRYACDHWIDHLLYSDNPKLNWTDRVSPRDENPILDFLREHLLHWIEARILGGGHSAHIGVELEKLLEFAYRSDEDRALQMFLEDVCSFLELHEDLFDESPLQLYSSAILFSPRESLVRHCFQTLMPSWISMEQPMFERLEPTLFRALDSPVMAISNEMFLSLESECLVGVCDIVSEKRLRNFRTDRPVLRAWFSPDPDTICLATDEEVSSWMVTSGVKTQSLTFDKAESDEIFFSDDGNIVVLLFTRDRMTPGARVKDLIRQTDQEVILLHDPKRLFKTDGLKILVTNDGNFLAAMGPEGYRVYDLTSKTWWEERLQEPLYFSSNCKLFASGTDDGDIQIIDLATRKILKEVPNDRDQPFKVSRFSDDSRFWVGMNTRGWIQVWDIASRHLMLEWRGIPPSRSEEVFRGGFGTMLSRDAQRLIVTTERRPHLIWKVLTHHDPAIFKSWRRRGRSLLGPVILSQDFRLLAFWSDGIHATDAKTGRTLLSIPHGEELESENHPYFQLGFSRDSKTIFASHPDLGLRRYDIASGREMPLSPDLNGFIDSKSSLTSGSLSKTGEFASMNDDGFCLFWNLNSNEAASRQLACRGLPTTRVFLSANGQYLTVQSDPHHFRVWDVAKDAEAWSFVCEYCADSSTEQRICGCDLSVSNDGSAVLCKNRSEVNAIMHIRGRSCFAVFVGEYFSLEGYDENNPWIQTEQGRVFIDDPTNRSTDHWKPPDATRWRREHAKFQISFYQRPAEGYGLRRPEIKHSKSEHQYWLTWNGENIMVVPWLFQPADSEESSVVVWQDGLAYLNEVGEFYQFWFSGPPDGKAEIAEEVS